MVAKWFLSKVEHVKKFTVGQLNTTKWSEKLICAFSSGELTYLKNICIFAGPSKSKIDYTWHTYIGTLKNKKIFIFKYNLVLFLKPK